MGPHTNSSCCCQARKSVMGPCTASSCCCQVQSVSWVPVRPPIAAVSIATLSSCATFRSPHTAGGFHFCHRVLYGLPLLLLPPPPHCGSTLWSWPPVTAQMSEVCCDSKIDGTHLHVILTVSIISLPQQTPRAFKLKVQCSALI
ncbi:unnamed protein product [Staurois parvus]|uniref:Uncharacterized protein n=1 Tax=Staurois parvus TaxID=386267 RepID=A0ABN9A7W5_9NEOB|nr:unnamed protein product [Staurois parvus]